MWNKHTLIKQKHILTKCVYRIASGQISELHSSLQISRMQPRVKQICVCLKLHYISYIPVMPEVLTKKYRRHRMQQLLCIARIARSYLGCCREISYSDHNSDTQVVHRMFTTALFIYIWSHTLLYPIFVFQTNKQI